MAYSGKGGDINSGAITEVTKWTFEPSVSIAKYASNSTECHKKAVAGTRDGKGTIEIKVPTGGVPWDVGESVTLNLQLNDDQGAALGAFAVPAVIGSAPISVDIDNGEIVGATYSFEADGKWSATGCFANLAVPAV